MAKLNSGNFTIRARRGTAANLALATTYVSEGELAYKTDTKVLAVGDASNGKKDVAMIDVANVFTANQSIQNALTLGTASTTAGTVILKNATSTGNTTIATGNISATNYTATLQAADGTIALTRILTAIKSAAYTVGTDNAQEAYGGVIYVDTAATITLPAAVAGMSVTVVTVGAIAVSVDPNASDKLYLDGTALADGNKATNLSTAGDIIVLTYYSADGWYASSNGWTDGGA